VTKTARIAVVGPGRIGRGIALAFALAGHEVALLDLKPRSRADAATLRTTVSDSIARELEVLVAAQVLTADSAQATAARCTVDVDSVRTGRRLPYEFYFEGVPEQPEVKRECYAWLGRAAAPAAIIASSTSTLPVDELAALVAHPARFLNAHWLNPAHLMPLVELSAAATTAPSNVERLRSLLQSIGKIPVTCSSSPGYIVPRLQALAMNEAARMVEEGVASAEDIDRAVRVGFGVRYAILGLLEFIDWGGGDILHHASEHLSRSLDAERFRAPPIIGENMAAHRRGLRDRQGFYDFRSIDVDAYRLERMVAFIALLGHLRLLPSALSTPPQAS
jgi:3-hydroxybutyryl-CoA dehydrogenase